MRITTKTGIYDVTGNKVYIEGLEEELPFDVDPEQVKYNMICESYTHPTRKTTLLPILGKSKAKKALDFYQRAETSDTEEIDLRHFDMNTVDNVKTQEELNEASDSLIQSTGCLMLIYVIITAISGGLILWFLMSILL